MSGRGLGTARVEELKVRKSHLIHFSVKFESAGMCYPLGTPTLHSFLVQFFFLGSGP